MRNSKDLRALILSLALPLSMYGQENAECGSHWYSKGGQDIQGQFENYCVQRVNDDEDDCDCEDTRRGPDPWPCGNFALPTSQQIGPLMSFGQLIVEQNDLIYYLYGHSYWGEDFYDTNLTPSILYGITDDLSVFLEVPFSTGSKEDTDFSAGIQDIALTWEYAYYTFNTRCSVNQATVVSSILFPTGHPQKSPATGFGAPAFFIGGTFSRMEQWQYYFASIGALFPTYNNGIKGGDTYYYEFGYGRTIWASRCNEILAWLIEFNGAYAKRDRFEFQLESDSGGNEIVITPSIYYATRHWVFAGGINFFAIHNLRGEQLHPDIGFSFYVGWKPS